MAIKWRQTLSMLPYNLLLQGAAEVVPSEQTDSEYIIRHNARHSFNPRAKTTVCDTSSSTHLAIHTRYISSVSVLSLCQT